MRTSSSALGLQYDFTESLGMRLEAERYRINDAVGNKGDVDLVSVGLVYRFGAKTPAPAPRAAAPEPVAAAPAPQPVAVTPPPAPRPAAVTAAAGADEGDFLRGFSVRFRQGDREACGQTGSSTSLPQT